MSEKKGISGETQSLRDGSGICVTRSREVLGKASHRAGGIASHEARTLCSSGGNEKEFIVITSGNWRGKDDSLFALQRR